MMNRISERVNIAACLGLALLILLPIGRAEGASDNASKQLDLATKKFGTLNEAEEKLFKAVEKGELADYSDKLEKNNDPNTAKDWDQNTRVIRAKCITWLCTDTEASVMVTHKGIRVKGARIDGELDLEFARISFLLDFEKSAFPGGINLRRAETRELFLIGTHTGPIYGDSVNIEGSVFLRDGFKAEGEVRLINATIGRNLECDGSQFINKGAEAINADGVNIEGSVFLRNGFKAEGEVNLLGATIGGNLDCGKGEFINPTGYALSAANSNIKGGVYLSKCFQAEGEVNLLGATIGGNLDCGKGEFINPTGYALLAANSNIKGNVFLRNGFKVEGEVNLLGATIGGQLDCEKGEFINKGAQALNANRMKIEGSVFLRNGFKAEGEVRLLNATIGGNLECDGSQFINKEAKAINADGVNIEGSVFLRDGFKAKGEVNLVGATIGGNLDCGKGMFINPTGCALLADNSNVKGSAFLLDDFKADGEVRLVGATIDSYLIWRDLNSPEKATLDLRSATVGTLYDDVNSWPDDGKLFLHGLVYKEIAASAPRDAESRIDWLRRQPKFLPQPYEQLAKVLRQSGHSNDARKINIALEKDKALSVQMNSWDQWTHNIYGAVLDYGFYKWKPFWWGLVIIILGGFIFRIGFSKKLLRPTKTDIYPKFNSLIYSLDTFVPLIDLHQSKYWLPDAKCGQLFNIKGFGLHTGGLLRLYFWMHIIMGWLLTTLLVVGLTGLIRT